MPTNGKHRGREISILRRARHANEDETLRTDICHRVPGRRRSALCPATLTDKPECGKKQGVARLLIVNAGTAKTRTLIQAKVNSYRWGPGRTNSLVTIGLLVGAGGDSSPTRVASTCAHARDCIPFVVPPCPGVLPKSLPSTRSSLGDASWPQ